MLLQVLAGLSHASAGTVRLAGLTRADDSPAGWARRVGYVGPEAGIYPWMTPREVLDLAGRIAEYGARERRRRIDALAEHYRIRVQLDEAVQRGGVALAERVALAAAMLTDPEVLLLNEAQRGQIVAKLPAALALFLLRRLQLDRNPPIAEPVLAPAA